MKGVIRGEEVSAYYWAGVRGSLIVLGRCEKRDDLAIFSFRRGGGDYS